jgi:hypothetical protein
MNEALRSSRRVLGVAFLQEAIAISALSRLPIPFALLVEAHAPISSPRVANATIDVAHDTTWVRSVSEAQLVTMPWIGLLQSTPCSKVR